MSDEPRMSTGIFSKYGGCGYSYLPTQLPLREIVGRDVRGEKLLMIAILEEAIKTYLRHCNKENREQIKEFLEVKDWFLSKSKDWMYSIESICEWLDLNPDWVRRSIFSKKSSDAVLSRILR